MLNNLKIGTRLAIGFAIALTLLITISVVSLTRINDIASATGMITDDRMPKIEMSGDMLINVLGMGRSVRSIILSNDKAFEKAQTEIVLDLNKKNGEILDKLKPMINTAKGKELFDKLTEARAKYAPALDTLLPLANSSSPTYNADKAAQYLFGEYSVFATNYVDAVKAFASLQKELAAKSSHEATEAAATAKTLVMVLSAIGVLLSVIIAFIITRSITRPLGEAVKISDKIAEGDLSVTIDTSAKDEVGAVLSALERAVTAVKLMSGEAGRLAQAAVDGKLNTRADATQYQGEYRNIVQGVNNTLDAVIGPLNVTAKYVDDISKGVIPPVITDNYNGDFNIIKNNLNNLVKMMSELLAQTDIIIKGAADGQLDKRANADLFVGGWNQLVKGVNETITNIVDPLNVTANYVDQIAKGAIPARITTIYKGDYNTIKNNLNACIDAVNNLVADASMLSAAAVEGRLETRADASRHQGDFQRVVKGVNDTLDNVVEPINEVRRIMGAMSNGDLSQTITTSYRGDFDELKNAINQTVVKLVSIIGEVRVAADNLTNAASQVAATAQSLSQSSSEQAASVEETTSSMEQMTASISQNTENANVTDGMAAKAAREAAEGGEAVTRTVDDMKSIASKIGIIDDIAYQTNLLALNAAIEAARAGDHGKGFAVVAAEVRKLAERSQVAAQEIGDLASSSVKQAERAGTLLTEMVPTIRKTSDLVQEIAAASTEQSSGVGQINGAMSQLNQATQQNASASEELAATAEELGSQAEQLQQTMTFFHLDDNQRHASHKVSAIHPVATRAKSRVNARAPAVIINEGDFERY